MLFHEERYALHELGSTAAEAGGVATVFNASAVLVSGSATAPIGTVAAVEEEAEEASGGTPPPVAHMLFQVWKYSAQVCSAAGIWMDGEGDSKVLLPHQTEEAMSVTSVVMRMKLAGEISPSSTTQTVTFHI